MNRSVTEAGRGAPMTVESGEPARRSSAMFARRRAFRGRAFLFAVNRESRDCVGLAREVRGGSSAGSASQETSPRWLLREARGERMRIVTAEPLNAESPLEALREDITPLSEFFVRSHFSPPNIARRDHVLSVGGAVHHELRLNMDDLEAMGTRRFAATLE